MNELPKCQGLSGERCGVEVVWVVRISPTPCCHIDHDTPGPWFYCDGCLRQRLQTWGSVSEYKCPQCGEFYTFLDRLVSIERL